MEKEIHEYVWKIEAKAYILSSNDIITEDSVIYKTADSSCIFANFLQR